MQATSRVVLVGLLLFHLALVGAGAAVGTIETRAYLAGGITPAGGFDELARGIPDGGVSVASRKLTLTRCLDAMASLVARVQPTARRRAVQRNCLQISDAFVVQEPTNSLAWYVGAFAAGALSDTVGMATRLGEAQRTGPSEQWLAQMRVELAEENYAVLPASVREGQDRDLTLLALSRDGVASIAQRYVGQVDFRSRITRLVEQLPQAEQQRFLGYVKQATERVGGQ